MTYKTMYETTDDNVFEVVGRDLDEWKDFTRFSGNDAKAYVRGA